MDIGGVLVSLIGDLDHDSKLLAWLDGCVAVPVVEDNLLNLNVRIPVIPGGHPDQAVSAGVDYIGHSVFEIRGVGKYGINNKLPAFIYESVFAVIVWINARNRTVHISR